MFINKENKIKWKLLAVATAVVFAIVAMGIAWFDKPLYLFLRGMDCRIWKLFDVVFDAAIWIVASAIILVVFWAKKATETKVNFRNSKHYINLWAILRDFFDKTKNSYAFYVFCAVLSASVFAKVLKVIVGRARPIFFEALDMTGFFPFTMDWAFNSMPSGHAVASFAGLVMLGMLIPRYKWATWTLAIVIGVSRVCVGAHWPTDVILGAFIGMVFADFVKSYIKQHFAAPVANAKN